jgi:HD-GYP domain-containing protein (c-di-GMP phosphodiesterase class II)
MNVYIRFRKQLVVNYLIGSTLAVGVVGSVFIFSTLTLKKAEMLYMFAILMTSFIVMITLESLRFFKDLKPISSLFEKEIHEFDALQRTFDYLHEFPLITFKRIMGPHLFGLSIPAMFLTFFAINQGLINSIPYHYIFLALAGAMLVAGMHAIIEFFLAIKAVQPVVKEVENITIRQFGEKHSLKGKLVLSIKRKFQFSFIFISVFPILLFGLATQVKLGFDTKLSQSFWSWAAVIIVLGLLFAYYGAKLLFSDIHQPIVQLRESMKEVQKGMLAKTDALYSDEFAGLVNGFNHMVEAIQARDEKNKVMFEGFLESMTAALDARDRYTFGHSTRVAAYSLEIGMKAGLSEEELTLLKTSALLHDIGKIGIADRILLKDGRLTDEEFESIKKHPEIGRDIIKQVQGFSELQPVMEGVLYHHERYDGKGYPEGLAGENIPLFGRILAVADAFDAMTSNRPYRLGMPIEKALAIISEGRGTQWDPAFADLFIELKQGNARNSA